jgi:hypothetical protein
MLIPNSRIYRDIEGKKVVEVKSVSDVLWDKIETTFPSTNTDLFSYYKNDVLVMTVLVTYSSNAKKDIVLVEKTRFD